MKRVIVLLAVLVLVMPAEAQRFRWPSVKPSVPSPKPTPKLPPKLPPGNPGGSSGGQQFGGGHSISGGSFRGLPVNPPPLSQPPGTKIVIVVLAPKLLAPPSRTPGTAAGHADDLPFDRLKSKKWFAGIDNELRRTSDPLARVQLVASRSHANALTLVASKKTLESSNHAIESVITELPEPVQKPVRAWIGVKDSCASLTTPWDQSAPVTSRLCRSLKDINEVDPKLAKNLQAALVKKAEKSGKPEIEWALRDLEMVSPESAPMPARVREVLPLPEAPAGTAAGQKGSLFAALDELPGDAKKQASTIYTNAHRALDRLADVEYTLARLNLSRLSQRLIEATTDDKKDRKDRIEDAMKVQGDTFGRVEAGLGRKLRPSERLIVADMRCEQVNVIVSTIAALK